MGPLSFFPPKSEFWIPARFANEQEMIKEALDNVNTDYLRNYHETLTKEPHIAGMKRDIELTNYIKWDVDYFIQSFYSSSKTYF